jgi:hypothetical protein
LHFAFGLFFACADAETEILTSFLQGAPADRLGSEFSIPF